MPWKALAEIYTMHPFSPFSWDPSGSQSSMFYLKIAKMFANSLPKFAKFVKISLEFVDFRAELYRNFTKSCRINEKDLDVKKRFKNLYITRIRYLRKFVKINCEI